MTSTPTPPKADRRSHNYTHHGITLTDDYAWLKDANWQQVLREPSLLVPEIRAYLEAENAYSNAVLVQTEPLQKQLVAEMRGRIKEDDSTVPSPDGPFAYFTKYREGGQHRMIGRQPRHGGDARFLIDGTDPRVTYWEPAKWIARLRATMTSGGPVLLRTNMGAGHGGASGRFNRLDEIALAYAFALWAVKHDPAG